MSKHVEIEGLSGLASRLGAFVLERYPLALDPVLSACTAIQNGKRTSHPTTVEGLRLPMRKELERRLARELPAGLCEPTPGVAPRVRMEAAHAEVVDAVDGFLQREALVASLSPEEKREILRGMLLTRATDTRLKQFFASGEIRYDGTPFQGKGFRSLGQEAIYAGGIRLRRGSRWRGTDGLWHGDIVGPMIRDLGIAFAMRGDADAVRGVLSAQMGKAGPPMHGRDLHVGDWEWGVLPPAAPLAIS